MNQNEAIAQALAQLLDEVQRLQMAEQVQKGMWTLLVGHLAAKELLDQDLLAVDVERLGSTQSGEMWQSLHEGYLAMLDALKSRASAVG